MPDWVPILGHQQKESASRSDILKPLIWPMGISTLAALGLAVADQPIWLVATCGSISLVFLIMYAVTYALCALKKPDLLRSEHYELNKMAIERGFFGDSMHGEAKIVASSAISPAVARLDNAQSAENEQ